MFETRNAVCLVLSFENYISHLNPRNEYHFQRPKRVVKQSDNICYYNMVNGQRTLGDKMKNLSRSTKLSHLYTNHSIRATIISIPDECVLRSKTSCQYRVIEVKIAYEVMLRKQACPRSEKCWKLYPRHYKWRCRTHPAMQYWPCRLQNRSPLLPINCNNLLIDSQEDFLLNEIN